MNLICKPGQPCDAHRNRDADPKEECPGYCDAEGCRKAARFDIDGMMFCRLHTIAVLELLTDDD